MSLPERAALALAGVLTLASSLGCSEAEVVAELRSLQASEDAVFVCRDAAGNGHPFAECPDRDAADDDEAKGNLSVFALVSQTVTDEVAVVDVSAGKVVDVDPGTPGYGFLRVGGRPISMAASPGGAATFVATAEIGRNGIFALPTSCIDRPSKGEVVRDLTSWPSCRLDSAPGEIAVLVQPKDDDGKLYTRCDPADPDWSVEDAAEVPAGGTGQCPANLQQEGGPEGRRKLVVSLPDEGQLVVIDAQALLDLEPGSFPACPIDARLQLDTLVPGDIAQKLPADLETSCVEVPAPSPPAPSRRPARPAGFAPGEGRLYIADEGAPVIHVVDTTNACSLTELPALLPMSLREPGRVVTTRRVAVSPLTPSGKQYVYAIDAEDQPGASVMAFDVSPDSQDRTPIVRPGSPELPGERPDRLALSSSAKDVAFAYRDLPYVDPSTGVGTFGTLCDPDPELARDLPAALARPNSDFSSGARPGLLRGLFGFVLMTNGNIAVVDVEDFDGPCRRPARANSSSTPDFRGCVNDPDDISFYTQGGEPDQAPTVTDEVSCRVVEPHRFRSATLAINDPDVGVRAPALRGFPQLTLPQSVASSTEPEDRPRLLAVPFVGVGGDPVAAEVFVGSTRFSTDTSEGEPLPVAPNSRVSEQAQSLNSLVLPPLQPRAYAPEDSVSLTYEGSFAGERSAGFLRAGNLLEDASLSFCAAGVYDESQMAAYAQDELGLDAAASATFAREHADYVQLTSALLSKDDTYWKHADVSYAECVDVFGPDDAEDLNANRDFHVVSAFADHLVLEPRGAATFEMALACFPTANSYRVRAGKHWVLVHAATGFNHDIVESGGDRSCVRSCSPLKKWAKSRAFELSSDAEHCLGPKPEGDPLDLRVGCQEPDEVACVYDQTASDDGAVQIGGPGSECIFDGLTERFALYRGRAPSKRDAAFVWQTTGGFSPLTMSLANVSTTVAPQSLQFLHEPELLAVVDGAGLGLSLFSLDTFGIVRPSPFY